VWARKREREKQPNRESVSTGTNSLCYSLTSSCYRAEEVWGQQQLSKTMSKSADYKSQGALGDDPSLPLKWEAGLDQVIRLKWASQRAERHTKDKSVLLCFDLKASEPSLVSSAFSAQQLWVNTVWFLLIRQMRFHFHSVFRKRAHTSQG